MERKNYTQEEYEQADRIPLVELAQSLGYRLERAGINRLRVKEMDSIEIDPAKNCFYRHSWEMGGGPVQFMKTVMNMDTVQAVRRLLGYGTAMPIPKSREYKEKPEAPFVLPERAPHHRHAFAYLNRERKIAPEIISEMMHQKRLYETVFSHKGRDYYNCVFVGMDADGKAVHAATRFSRQTEGKAWRIAPGSDSAFPFAMEGKNDVLVVYESAIDAMSGATLDSLKGKDWRQNHRIALCGLSRKPVEQYLKGHPEVKRLVFCLDNDLSSAQKGGENHGQEAARDMAEYFRSLHYVVERLVTQEKDVNSALQNYVATLAEEIAEQGNSQEEDEWTNGQ